jgi:two-component system nitrogen regulation sensor histidine kinase NtrY
MMNNLIDNAVEAVHEVEGPSIRIATHLNSALKIVRIEVVDNGKGIVQEILSRIFEPYVTSKRDGTGLGLAIVKRTVEDHNGFIRAFSEAGKGTRFLIELPYMAVASDKEIRFKGSETDRGEHEIT